MSLRPATQKSNFVIQPLTTVSAKPIVTTTSSVIGQTMTIKPLSTEPSISVAPPSITQSGTMPSRQIGSLVLQPLATKPSTRKVAPTIQPYEIVTPSGQKFTIKPLEQLPRSKPIAKKPARSKQPLPQITDLSKSTKQPPNKYPMLTPLPPKVTTRQSKTKQPAVRQSKTLNITTVQFPLASSKTSQFKFVPMQTPKDTPLPVLDPRKL